MVDRPKFGRAPTSAGSLDQRGFRRNDGPPVTGRPVSGATVVFTLAPPGLDAQNFTTTSNADGIARWDGVTITGASRGNGWVTARAELGGGLEAALATKGFSVK